MTQTQEIKEQGRGQKSMYALILGLALPNIISNISVPLLSMADTAIAGRLGTITALGAVGLASIVNDRIYSTSLWSWRQKSYLSSVLRWHFYRLAWWITFTTPKTLSIRLGSFAQPRGGKPNA